MTGRELYERYAGWKASYRWEGEIAIGTVVGYDEDSLIMAVEEGSKGWQNPDTAREFVEDSWKDHEKGFLFVTEKDILPREGKI